MWPVAQAFACVKEAMGKEEDGERLDQFKILFDSAWKEMRAKAKLAKEASETP